MYFLTLHLVYFNCIIKLLKLFILIFFTAPQEYMLRPPQPAVYLILLDVSHSAVETGYLEIVCQVC